MNFFTYETQVSAGLHLIGRGDSALRKKKTARQSTPLSASFASTPSREAAPTPTRAASGLKGGSPPDKSNHVLHQARVQRRSPGPMRHRRNSVESPGRSRAGRGHRGPASPQLASRSDESGCARHDADGSWVSQSDGDLDVTVPRLQEDAPGLHQSSSSKGNVGGDAADTELAARRAEEATGEAVRVLALERSAFPSVVHWAFAVLGVSQAEQTQASVQKCYRALMKKLHPDKAVQSPPVMYAVERIQEAKAICERSLCRHELPGVPRRLSATPLPGQLGERRFCVQWSAPERSERAPVLRYVVAVADPVAPSRPPIRLCTLEPDYSQELGRYVDLEELERYELAEEEASARVPGLFKQKDVTVMVSAANKVGQSSWASVCIDLSLHVSALVAEKPAEHSRHPLYASPSDSTVEPSGPGSPMPSPAITPPASAAVPPAAGSSPSPILPLRSATSPSLVTRCTVSAPVTPVRRSSYANQDAILRMGPPRDACRGQTGQTVSTQGVGVGCMLPAAQTAQWTVIRVRTVA